MSLTTLALLPNTVYGVPSGNYDGSSQDFHGVPVLAANYYQGQGSIQTVTITVSGFIGEIVLEATLNDTQAVNTDQARWFETQRFGDPVLPNTGTFPITITGNFSYMRARVLGFDAGTITGVTITY